MSKFKKYKELENSLLQKLEDRPGNEVYLNEGDFQDGRLSVFGYERLKQKCDYISYSEDIEIFVPVKYESAVKKSLNYLGARELHRIKKDRREAMLLSALLLAIGILWLVLGYFLDLYELHLVIVKDIIIVASWVFVWAAVEKFFFDRRKLMDRRFSLLQILSAKVTGRDIQL